MTRQIFWLLLFADLTILPGCRVFTSPDGDPSRPVIPERSEVDYQINSTAGQRDEDKPAFTKVPAGPTHVVEVTNTSRQKKPDEHITGIVTLEPGFEPRALQVDVKAPLLPIDKKAEYEPVVLALQCMLEGRHPEAIKHLSAYDAEKQQLLLRLLPPLTFLVKKRIEDLSVEEVAMMKKQFDSFLDEIRPRSELVIGKMCYCKKVRNYGDYDSLPDHHQFLTGTQDRIGEMVQLYIELKNFASEPTKGGEYLTKLSCSLELQDSTGKQVWSKRFDGKETTLLRRTRLTDFYGCYGFYVPAIPPGTYRLTLRVADETNPQRIRETSNWLEFRVTPVANQSALK